MKYSEIVDTALKYSMRTDKDTVEMMDNFLRIVESRIDRALNVSEMAHRATLTLDEDQEYFGLPSGFLALRDIQIQDGETETGPITPVYVSPERMNVVIRNNCDTPVYTLIANQLQIFPIVSGQQIEIVYSRRIPPLTESEPTNWLADTSLDAYIFGLLVEISSFAKDSAATTLWESRFSATINAIQTDDDVSRWSGPQLRIQLG